MDIRDNNDSSDESVEFYSFLVVNETMILPTNNVSMLQGQKRNSQATLQGQSKEGKMQESKDILSDESFVSVTQPSQSLITEEVFFKTLSNALYSSPQQSTQGNRHKRKPVPDFNLVVNSVKKTSATPAIHASTALSTEAKQESTVIQQQMNAVSAAAAAGVQSSFPVEKSSRLNLQIKPVQKFDEGQRKKVDPKENAPAQQRDSNVRPDLLNQVLMASSVPLATISPAGHTSHPAEVTHNTQKPNQQNQILRSTARRFTTEPPHITHQQAQIHQQLHQHPVHVNNNNNSNQAYLRSLLVAEEEAENEQYYSTLTNVNRQQQPMQIPPSSSHPILIKKQIIIKQKQPINNINNNNSNNINSNNNNNNNSSSNQLGLESPNVSNQASTVSSARIYPLINPSPLLKRLPLLNMGAPLQNNQQSTNNSKESHQVSRNSLEKKKSIQPHYSFNVKSENNNIKQSLLVTSVPSATAATTTTSTLSGQQSIQTSNEPNKRMKLNLDKINLNNYESDLNTDRKYELQTKYQFSLQQSIGQNTPSTNNTTQKEGSSTKTPQSMLARATPTSPMLSSFSSLLLLEANSPKDFTQSEKTTGRLSLNQQQPQSHKPVLTQPKKLTQNQNSQIYRQQTLNNLQSSNTKQPVLLKLQLNKVDSLEALPGSSSALSQLQTRSTLEAEPSMKEIDSDMLYSIQYQPSMKMVTEGNENERRRSSGKYYFVGLNIKTEQQHFPQQQLQSSKNLIQLSTQKSGKYSQLFPASSQQGFLKTPAKKNTFSEKTSSGQGSAINSNSSSGLTTSNNTVTHFFGKQQQVPTSSEKNRSSMIVLDIPNNSNMLASSSNSNSKAKLYTPRNSTRNFTKHTVAMQVNEVQQLTPRPVAPNLRKGRIEYPAKN